MHNFYESTAFTLISNLNVCKNGWQSNLHKTYNVKKKKKYVLKFIWKQFFDHTCLEKWFSKLWIKIKPTNYKT